ncbi:hypothetical protein C8R44DRAFT_726480 [Mycena epipterygia]|nr:hypothetical protein C8R44DRAFT_726480 [Mycena epipterygia]
MATAPRRPAAASMYIHRRGERPDITTAAAAAAVAETLARPPIRARHAVWGAKKPSSNSGWGDIRAVSQSCLGNMHWGWTEVGTPTRAHIRTNQKFRILFDRKLESAAKNLSSREDDRKTSDSACGRRKERIRDLGRGDLIMTSVGNMLFGRTRSPAPGPGQSKSDGGWAGLCQSLIGHWYHGPVAVLHTSSCPNEVRLHPMWRRKGKESMTANGETFPANEEVYRAEWGRGIVHYGAGRVSTFGRGAGDAFRAALHTLQADTRYYTRFFCCYYYSARTPRVSGVPGPLRASKNDAARTRELPAPSLRCWTGASSTTD